MLLNRGMSKVPVTVAVLRQVNYTLSNGLLVMQVANNAIFVFLTYCFLYFFNPKIIKSNDLLKLYIIACV